MSDYRPSGIQSDFLSTSSSAGDVLNRVAGKVIYHFNGRPGFHIDIEHATSDDPKSPITSIKVSRETGDSWQPTVFISIMDMSQASNRNGLLVFLGSVDRHGKENCGKGKLFTQDLFQNVEDELKKFNTRASTFNTEKPEARPSVVSDSSPCRHP